MFHHKQIYHLQQWFWIVFAGIVDVVAKAVKGKILNVYYFQEININPNFI